MIAVVHTTLEHEKAAREKFYQKRLPYLPTWEHKVGDKKRCEYQKFLGTAPPLTLVMAVFYHPISRRTTNKLGDKALRIYGYKVANDFSDRKVL